MGKTLERPNLGFPDSQASSWLLGCHTEESRMKDLGVPWAHNEARTRYSHMDIQVLLNGEEMGMELGPVGRKEPGPGKWGIPG